MVDKKSFFERKTPTQIKEGKEAVLLEGRVVSVLQELQPHQYAVIPEQLFDPRFGDPAKYFKHGETYRLSNRPFGKTPRALLREAVHDPQVSFNKYMSGYSFVPRHGPDRVPRRVPFIELLEAARILAYGKVFPDAAVRVEGEYINAKKARTEGGSFLVSTPSRTQKHSRYRFTVKSIPLAFSEPEVYLIPYSFNTQDLGVESKVFRELRFTRAESQESSQVNYIQAHEIAAAYVVAEEQRKKRNNIPLRFLVFPAVSQQAVDLYVALLERTLLQVQEKEIVRQNNLTQAHIEAIMWRLVHHQGYAAGFDDKALSDGRLGTYNWNYVPA